MFFDGELVELIVRETNTYAAQKIKARSVIPLRSRMRDWKPAVAYRGGGLEGSNHPRNSEAGPNSEIHGK
jgi:hypothetical protein